MFREIILPIFRSTRLCVTACGIMHRRCCRPGIINKPLLLHLDGCLYYLYQCCTVKQISDNEIYLLIKYIKSVLWRVAKRLSYIQDARCLKKFSALLLHILFSPVVCVYRELCRMELCTKYTTTAPKISTPTCVTEINTVTLAKHRLWAPWWWFM